MWLTTFASYSRYSLRRVPKGAILATVWLSDLLLIPFDPQCHQMQLWKQILSALGFPPDPATNQQPDARAQALAQVRPSPPRRARRSLQADSVTVVELLFHPSSFRNHVRCASNSPAAAAASRSRRPASRFGCWCCSLSHKHRRRSISTPYQYVHSSNSLPTITTTSSTAFVRSARHSHQHVRRFTLRYRPFSIAHAAATSAVTERAATVTGRYDGCDGRCRERSGSERFIDAGADRYAANTECRPVEGRGDRVGTGCQARSRCVQAHYSSARDQR